jgi:rhodanese-related sulfurtransferase
MSQIDAATLQQRIQNGETLNLLDVREAIEYHTFNIGGQNIPVGKLKQNINSIIYNKTDEIIVICSAGIRSETAIGYFSRKRFYPRNKPKRRTKSPAKTKQIKHHPL